MPALKQTVGTTLQQRRSQRVGLYDPTPVLKENQRHLTTRNARALRGRSVKREKTTALLTECSFRSSRMSQHGTVPLTMSRSFRLSSTALNCSMFTRRHVVSGLWSSE